MMLHALEKSDAEFLLGRAEFRRFLFLAIQSAGILSNNPHADGRLGSDLFEGRRSLGLELLQMADEGQPEPLRSSQSLATLNAILLEALNPPTKEKPDGRRTDRYEHLERDE